MKRKPAIPPPINRNAAGAIDFDFDAFRIRAVALHGEAKRELAMLRSLTVGLLAVVTIVVVCFAAAVVGAPSDLAAMTQIPISVR